MNIVISGASRGIGLELAKEYAKAGHKLALISLSSLEKTKIELQSLGAQDLLTYQCDIKNSEAVSSAIQDIVAKWGQIDLAIANAGIGGQNPADAFDQTINREFFEVNFFGMISLFTPIIPIMKRQTSGHLVGVSSLAAFRGLPNSASYCASKSAQRILLESFRVDLKKHGIAVSSIHPGFIKTDMTSHNDFPMPFMITANECAKLMIKAIYRKKSHYLFPWPMKVLTTINRLLPDALYDFILTKLTDSPKELKAKIF